MYYPTNQYQNQPQNFTQNTVPITTPPKTIINPNQHQHQAYTVQPNQIIGQPQYPKTHIAQTFPQAQNLQNYQNVQRQQPGQTIQYVQVPGQPNTYAQYTQPVQQVLYGQQPQQVQQVPGKQPIKGHTINQNISPVIQDPNLAQATNQKVSPQKEKLVFKAPKPLSVSQNQSLTTPTLPPVALKQTHAGMPEAKNKNPNGIGANQPHYQNKTMMNQTLNPNNTILNQPGPTTEQKNKVEPKLQAQIGQNEKKPKKTASLMTVNSLVNLPYKNYPQVIFSSKPFLNISGYGSNSYNGKIKTYNEDKVKIQYKVSKNFIANDGKQYQAFISYFGIFDGHGGDKCSKFLRDNLDRILFNQTMFPNNVVESVRETFNTAERNFKQIAVQNNQLKDKSGSCACIALIINDILYSINLGDSRALYSYDSGKQLYQITRDHKPDDQKERARIEKAGGQVYYANKTFINGVEVTLKEEQFGPGFKFPYRLAPSGLAVSFYKNFLNFY